VHTFAATGDADEFARLGARVFGTPLGVVDTIPVGLLAEAPSRTALESLPTTTGEPTCA
jgi:hypothetical protein